MVVAVGGDPHEAEQLAQNAEPPRGDGRRSHRRRQAVGPAGIQ